MAIGIFIGNTIGNQRVRYWTPSIKPYFTIDNTGNNQALVDAQIKITLTGADVTIASIAADGSNLYFYDKSGFLHSYLNYKDTDVCEVYVKVSCPALKTTNIGFKIQSHAFADDYANVMVRRTAHASTNMLYACADEHDSLAVGPDITLANGAAVLATKFGDVLNFDGINDYATVDIIKTIPNYGGFGFNFILPDNSWDNGVAHTIMSKIWDASTYIVLSIKSNGLPWFQYRWGSSVLAGTYTGTNKLEVGKIHSFYIRWTKLSTVVYLDGVIIHAGTIKITASPSNNATVVFGAYDASVQRTKCYVYDIEYDNLALPSSSKRAWAENISIFNRTQTEKIQQLSIIPASPNANSSWGEGSIIFKNNDIWIYHNQSYADADHAVEHNMLRLSISHDNGVTWDAPIDIMGYTTGTESTKGIYQPTVFEDGGKYYCVYRRHDDTTQLLIRESTDGLTFTNPQKFLGNDHGTPYNSSIINDNGVYKGLVDIGVTIDGFASYVQYYIEGNTLLTMAYGAMQSTIGSRSIYNYGAPCLLKIGTKYVCWTEQSLRNEKVILPDCAYYSECDDPSANEWTTKSIPVMDLDSSYADDQVVDGCVAENGGNTYIVTGKNNNNYPFIMAFYKYAGTIARFIKDITVNSVVATISGIAKTTSDTTIDLTWSGNQATSINRSTDGINYSEIATKSAGVNLYTDSSLTADTTYYYKFCTVGNSDYSNVCSTTTFKAESQALFVRMNTAGDYPDHARKVIINTTLKALIDNGLLAKADICWLPAQSGQLSGALNWISASYPVSEQHVPLWTVDRGYTGDGANDYLKTGYNPNGGGLKYTQDDATISVYSRTSAAAASCLAGAIAASTKGGTNIYPRYTGDHFYAKINGGTQADIACSNGAGLFTLVRDSSTTFKAYVNKTKTDCTATSDGTPKEIYILAYNNNGTMAYATSREVSFVWLGSKLTPTEQGLLYDIIVDGYLDSIGAKV